MVCLAPVMLLIGLFSVNDKGYLIYKTGKVMMEKWALKSHWLGWLCFPEY